MNRKQREKNRQTFAKLMQVVKNIKNARYICPNCNNYGMHWVQLRGISLQGLVNSVDDSVGFWICAEDKK